LFIDMRGEAAQSAADERAIPSEQRGPFVAKLRQAHERRRGHRHVRPSAITGRDGGELACRGRDSPESHLPLGQQAGKSSDCPPQSQPQAAKPKPIRSGLLTRPPLQWIQFDAEARDVERLLLTDFYFYEHGATASQDLACSAYHLPRHIAEHVDYVTPGVRLRRDPRRVAKVRRRERAEQLARRHVGTTNTGVEALGSVHGPAAVRPAASTPLGVSPFNSTVCWELITNVCIRSELTRGQDSDLGCAMDRQHRLEGSPRMQE
jgi:hypothetical protein